MQQNPLGERAASERGVRVAQAPQEPPHHYVHEPDFVLIGGSAPGSRRIGDELVRRGLISREKLQLALVRQRELYPSARESLEPDANGLATVLLHEKLVDERQLSRTLFGRYRT